MTVKFGKFTQKIQKKIQEFNLSEKVSDIKNAEVGSIFSSTTPKASSIQPKQSSTQVKAEEEFTEEEKKITAKDVLKSIADFFSDNSIQGILDSVLDSEKGDISDIDENNYITRDEAFAVKDDNDGFEDYCKSINIDLENATNNELTEAYTKYTQRVSEKNEFNELYKLFKEDPTLSSKLDDKVKIEGSLINKFMQGSLNDFYEDIAETGAFKTEGESGGILYNKRFDTKISAGLEQMKKLLNEEGVSEDVKAQAEAIIQKYENREKVAIGRRDGGSVNLNSEIDERVTQSGTGDCYLLATLNSLQETDAGKEIIKDAITDNQDGSYTVNLRGVNISYTFSTEDIEEAENAKIMKKAGDGSVVGTGDERYSNGDDDAMLVELAVEKFREGIYNGTIEIDKNWPACASKTVAQEKYEEGQSALTGGAMSQVLYLLSGIESTSVDKDAISSTLDEIQKDIEENGSEYAIYAGVTAKNGYTEDSNGKYVIENGNYVEVTSSTPADATRYSFTGGGSNDLYVQDENGYYYRDENGRYRRYTDSVSSDESRYSYTGSSGITLGTKEEHIKITNNATGNHALSIVNITDDTVTVINPWDSDNVVEVNRDDFESYMYHLQYAKLPSKSATTIS